MKEAKIIVLAGQSNAVGVGHAQYLPRHFSPEQIKKYYDGYSNFKINYFSHDKKSGGFVDTTVGCTERSRKTIGPELGIAQWFTERNPQEFYFIVKCAFGGMSLYQDWLSPSGGDTYDKEAYADQKENIIKQYKEGAPIRAGWCYNELVRIMKDSIATLEAEGYTPRIKGFCWMQGESDADTAEHVRQYARLYGCLLSDFNAAFSDYLDDCIYVDGGISETWPFYKEMNEGKQTYAQTHKNCYYIDTIGEGLTVLNEPDGAPDIYHYDSDSVIKLGKLFAEKIGAHI